MGYYTAFELTATSESNNGAFPAEVIREIERMNVFRDAPYTYGHPNEATWYIDEIKWYDWEQDMCKLSAKFPDVFFELSGDGEESDDFWKAYFKGGLVQHDPARIEYDGFSPDKLGPCSDKRMNLKDKYSYEH